ncbi:RagB/SusD family nutrient uptake outer membrane protein [Pedobacter sp. MC2016-14]|uniref:RagB/SusD family nutrient uptake outer membrane protein n=1 Tax=Pedobacter sp. MC2016-14 TaxID=2897327 RepID=UPI001E318591|nr:RagB/SusD family nutrient uptake outer membrane protein [Pedobacter sp. MC2016-14]MCD0490069.1 RagB/SusD family nutrient uptake outer membrane protein [Pedobacter sp. MC2016-14]
MKKYTNPLFLLTLIPILLLLSCNKYLDVQPKGVQLLETIRDYDAWLNNMDLLTSTPAQLNMLDDHSDLPTVTATLTSSNEKTYTWQAQFSEQVPGTAIIWGNYYRAIYLHNTVINNVDKATGGTDQDRRRLKAESLLGRAFEYLSLVNLYAKMYNPSTAATDLAVPFVTSIDVTEPTPPRSTVQEIYNHIFEDINLALPDLPKDNATNRFRGTVAAAHGVMARAYLYMRNFPKAAAEAQLALDNGPNVVFDYKSATNVISVPALIRRPDVIYAKNSGLTYLGKEIPTLEFLKSFDTSDLRLKVFYTLVGDYSFTIRGRTQFQHYGVSSGSPVPTWAISVADMRLILAEVAARNNETAVACDQLDLLRKMRFPAATYVKFSSTDKEEVLQKVLTERGLELAFCGNRWFDMRRLDAEGRMPAVNRYNGVGQIIATLAPGSPRYVLQIPAQILYYNQDWAQNP